METTDKKFANAGEGRDLELLLAIMHQENSAPLKLGSAELLPCALVTEWGERLELLLFLPLQAMELEEYNRCLCSACDYAQKHYARSSLALLCFSSANLAQLAPAYNFRPAWEYAITVFVPPISEQEVWLLPLYEEKLQQYGGEVDLPREFGVLWRSAVVAGEPGLDGSP